MDRFLESFQTRSTPQKIAIIVGVTALFLLVLLVLYVVTTPPNSNTNQAQNTQVPQITPIPVHSNPSPSSNNPSTQAMTYFYNGKGYSIIYPADWRTEKATASGVESTRFIPSANGNGVYSPSLKIKVINYLQTEFQKMESDQLLYFRKEVVQFNGISSEKFTGIIPPPGFKGPPTKNTYNSSYLFTKNNLIFLIEYVYDGSVPDANWEAKINSILGTLRFTQ
jgi:hypothetical protein